MKEMLRQASALREAQGLTKQSLGGYPSVMEGKPDMPPTNSSSSSPEHPEGVPGKQTKPVSVEQQAAARKAWMDMIGDRKLSVEERRTLEAIIAQGQPPITGGAGNEDEGRSPNSSGGGRPGQQSPPEDNGRHRENEPVITDKKAADLISKFRTENGINNPEKISNLRSSLSGRIRELEIERDGIVAKKESLNDDGEMTPQAAAATEELNNRMRGIQEFLSGLPLVETEGGERDDGQRDLLRRSHNFIEGLKRRGLTNDPANDLSKLTEEEKNIRLKLVEDIDNYLKNSPSPETFQFPSSLLSAVRYFKELREGVISEILFKSFEDKSETNDYEVGLYASSNLDYLLGFLSKDDNEAYKYFFSLRTAARYFQTMNSTVIKGNFEHFSQAAENINYQHFENMRDIGGSGLAMRLYEQAYKDVLASDKRVMQDKVAGIIKFVETTFREMNEAGLIKSGYAQYRKDSKMEDWEVRRALATGRTFLNITLRTAETIATGRVPEDRRRYASEPQEDMVRILNWNEWLLRKFTSGGDETGRHGKEFLKMSTDRFQDYLRYKGAKLDKNKIIEFGGVNVRKMEEGGQYRTSGVYSGWRLENMAFDQIYLKDVRDENGKPLRDEKKSERKPGENVIRDNEGKALMTVQAYRDRPEINKAIQVIKDRIDARKLANPNKDPKDLVTLEDQEEYKKILMPVVDNLNFGLSMLLKNGDFGMQDNKLGYLLRKEIWIKIAKTNTPIMIDYLSDIKYEENTPDSERALKIEELRKNIVPEWTDKQWESFRKKSLMMLERTIREGMGESLPSIKAADELTAEEKKMEDAIKTEGEKLAPHLADIVFAYTPFMNDMPFEKFHYDVTGQTFYKRRTVSDLGGYNKGQQSFSKIVDNPGGIAVKEAIEAMHDIVQGVAGPEGPRPGMEANFPTFSALLDVVTTDRGKRQAMAKMLLEATRTETSIAQRWAGIRADSFIESEEINLIADATRAGILNPELARYLRKNKRLTASALLWMLFRDILIMTPVFATGEFIGTFKGK
jgi:hypothetical protein